MILMEKVKRLFRSYKKRIVSLVLAFGIICISVLSSPINAHAVDNAFIYYDFGSPSGNLSGPYINNRSYTYLSQDFCLDLYPENMVYLSGNFSKDIYTSFTFTVNWSSDFEYREAFTDTYPSASTILSQISNGVDISDTYVVCTTTNGVYYLRASSNINNYVVYGYPISFQLVGKGTVWAIWRNGDYEALYTTAFKCGVRYTATSSISNVYWFEKSVAFPNDISNSITGGSGSSLTGSSDASSTNTSFGEDITSVNDTSDGYFDSFSTNMDSLDVVSNLSSIGVGFASVKLWMEAFYDKLPTPLQSVIFVSLYVGIIALLLSVLGRIKSHGGS